MASGRGAARAGALAVALAVLSLAPAVLAQPGAGPTTLEQASAALAAGEYDRAADLVIPLIGARQDSDLTASDRAEAWRIYGLALFFLGRPQGAESAFVEFFKLDVDGRLDPALFPPEVVTFFEDVRARHAALLHRYRPKPERKRSWALNFLPPAGQFQNGHRAKGWFIGSTGTVLLAANVTSYLFLRSWCDPQDHVCDSDNAGWVRTVNITSGVALLGVLTYGVVDGLVNYRRSGPRAHRRGRISVDLTPGGGSISLQTRF